MEVFGIMIPLFPTLIVAALGFLYYYATIGFNTFKKMGVSGPRPWPLLGNFVDMMRKAPADVVLEYGGRYGRIYGIFQGRDPTLVVNEAELIKEVSVKQFSNFSDRRDFDFGDAEDIFRYDLTRIKGDHWKHVRGQLAPIFTSGKLKMMMPLIDGCIEGLVSELDSSKGQDTDVKARMGGFSLAAIAATGFGIQVDSQKDPEKEPFVVNAKKIMEFGFTPLLILAILFPKCANVLAWFGWSPISIEATGFFRQAMKSRIDSMGSTSTRKDFLQQTLKNKIDVNTEPPEALRDSARGKWSVNGLTEQEILGNAASFLLAGYETTASLLQFALYSLAVEDGIQDRLREEVMSECGEETATYEQLMKMDYMEWFIMETQRLYPAVIALERICVKDTMLRDMKVTKGMIVQFSPFAVHRDPEYWPEPETFNPERFAPENRSENHQYVWLPFGAGPRNCIGMRLALLEVKAALSKIMQKFNVLPAENTPPKSQPMKWKTGATFLTTEKPFNLLFHPRQ